MTPAWLTLAADADLPLWVGCMVRAPHLPGSGLVVDISDGVAWVRWNDGRGVELRTFRPGEHPTPDLDHRPTRLEFVARVADRLGEPAEAECMLTARPENRNLALVRAWIAAGEAG